MIPWILLALAALGAVAGWSAYKAGQAVKEAARAVEGLDVDVSMQGVELSRGAEGRTEWRLKADGARYVQDTGLAQVDNPRIVYYLNASGDESRGNGTVEVTATHGEVDQQSGAAKLWPDVVIVTDGTHITAARLDYDGDARRIVLEGGVHMVRPGLDITAPRAVMDLATNEILAQGGVTAGTAVAPPRAKE